MNPFDLGFSYSILPTTICCKNYLIVDFPLSHRMMKHHSAMSDYTDYRHYFIM